MHADQVNALRTRKPRQTKSPQVKLAQTALTLVRGVEQLTTLGLHVFQKTSLVDFSYRPSDYLSLVINVVYCFEVDMKINATCKGCP